MMRVKSDGNGGLDVNVQKVILRRYGPIVLAALFVLSGFGSKIADEVWSLVITRKAQANEIEYLRRDVDENSRVIGEVREELRTELRAVRFEMQRLTEAILAEKENKK